jgi:hypothetical protein
VNVVRTTHPLCGERLAALKFVRRGGELMLVVILPDGTPGTIAAAATDALGDESGRSPAATVLSVEGVRRLRALVGGHEAANGSGRRQRARPWKVVRHPRGTEPFQRPIRVFSSHTSEAEARRARDRVRAGTVRAVGYEEAARSAWTVVHDPGGLLAVSPPERPEEQAR